MDRVDSSIIHQEGTGTGWTRGIDIGRLTKNSVKFFGLIYRGRYERELFDRGLFFQGKVYLSLDGLQYLQEISKNVQNINNNCTK